jgi:trimeric autotransporter adhesin
MEGDMKKALWVKVLVLGLILAAGCFAAFGYGVKKGKTPLDSLVIIKPELRVPETGEDFKSIGEGFVSQEGIANFLASNSGDWTVLVDMRRGVPTLIDGGAIPFIPGAANSIAWNSFDPGCDSIQCLSKAKIEGLAREFLSKYPGLFPVKQEELVIDPEGTVPMGESIYFLRLQWVVNDIPVEGASIFFRINNGNLIQVASSGIAPMNLDTNPDFTSETAWQILNGYLGEDGITEKDEIVEPGRLTILPVTPKGMDPDTYAGPAGTQSGFALCYRLVFKRPGVKGTWEALVDAHSGEMLRFVDSNRYGRIHGQIRPSDGLPPEADRPFPYANTGLASPNNYTDAAGNFTGNSATTTLTGKYAHIIDACGAINGTTTTGEIDFGGGPLDVNQTDCTVPSGNTSGAGNTKPSRTLFYNLTAINLKAQTFNPTNTWLTSSYMTANVNGTASCNASSGSGVVHFYKRDISDCTSQWYCCNNLGEIPGVAMHEWAHGYDTNDGSGGQVKPVETYADWTAIIQTHNSCTGAGFFQDGHGWNCSGYGNPCTACTGIRDCDYAKHSPATPWTSTNHGSLWTCSSGSYNGPCGWEDHCESGIGTQALWDFVYRDLQAAPTSMDLTSAWMLEDRLWFMGVATLNTMYTCSSGTTSGCTGNTLYTVMRAIDDDGDGTANGTPHAAAVFAALARHNIACGAAGDATNQNHTACPSLTTSTLSGAAGNNQTVLNWTTGGASATRYFIYKNESGCDVAFTKIATVTAPTLTYTDTACSNGMTYYYRIQSATANDSCTSSSSNCVTLTPQPCTASVTLNQSGYTCASTVNVTMLDSTPGAGPWQGEAWSTSDATHRTFTLAGSSPNFTGSFSTTSGAGGAGIVHVANGDTLTVRFVDPDNCGGGSLNVDQTATIDCAGPIISSVLATNVTGNSATITWTTSESANSRVTYDASAPPVTNKDDLATYVTSHSVLVTGLTQCTQYYFSVTSSDIAGNGTTDNNGGSYYTFTTGMNVNPTYASTDVPKAIPDLTTITSNIVVADNKTVQKVVVTIGNITHTYDADLDIFLIAPDNTRVELSTDNGSSGANYVNTVFDDAAAASITTATAPMTGTFKPEGSLATLIGKNAAGTWKLEVTDDASGDTGTLNGWSITFTYPPQSCGPSLEYQSNTFTDVCGGTGTGGGNTYIDPGEDITVQLTLHNNGSSGTTGIAGTLTTTTTGITVTDNSASFPDIAADGTGTSLADHFKFHVDGSVVCGTVINFNIHMACTENPAGWDSPFTMTVGHVVAGGAVTDFSETFESATTPNLPTGWTRSKTSGNDWGTSTSGCSGKALYYPYSSSQAANSWAYTPAISLTSGVTYTIGFNQKVGLSSYPEKMSVMCGTAANPAGQTITIMAEQTYTNTTCTARSYTFTVPTTGTYYIGFHCTSLVDEYNLYVDDVLVTHATAPSCTVAACVPSCTSPSAPAIGSITDSDACAQSGISISYTAGAPSTSDVLVVDSVEGPALTGSPYSYNPGNTTSHTYIVRTYNTASCHTDSSSQPLADADNSVAAPVISSVTDVSTCAQSGVTITWGAVAGATGYDLYFDGSTTVTTVNNPYVYNPGDTGSHNYQVRAKNASCTGSWSTVVAGTDSDSSVAAPVISSVTDVSACAQSGVTITWGAVAGATSYDLYVDAATSVTTVSSPYTYNPGNTASHNYQVRANNASCAGSWSTAVAGTDSDNSVGAPVISSVTDVTACSQSGVTITWGAVAGATGYDLYVDGSTTLTTVTSPYVYNPGDTSSHNYQVRAKNASCTGSWSTAVAGTDLNSGIGTPAIGSVTDVSACAQSGVTITWGAVTGATSYDLYVDATTTVAAVTSPYGYNPGDTASHNYQVRANDASCTGSWSTVVAGTDVNSSVAAPVIGSVTDVDACALSGVTVTWGAAAGATGYDLYVDATTTVASVASPYVYSPGDTNSHSYQVRAKNASCTGSWSTSAAGTDASNAPGTAAISSVLDGSPCALSGVTITWEAVTGATGYDLYIDSATTVADATSPYVYLPGDTNSHNYQVRAKNASCTGSWSTVVPAIDANDSPTVQPVITSIIDINLLTRGLEITYTPGSPAQRHDLYSDGQLAAADFISGDTFMPANSLAHSYQVAAVNGTCPLLSAPVEATDKGVRIVPRPRIPIEPLPLPNRN